MTNGQEGPPARPLGPPCTATATRPRAVALPRFALNLVLSAAATACGGGLPLLHPVRTLPMGALRAAAGLTGQVALGGLAGAQRNAANAIGTQPPQGGNGVGSPGADPAYARGALVGASVAPGISPIVAARVGVGASVEGGLTYSGRAVRADMRRSWDMSRSVSFGVGVGGSAVLSGRSSANGLGTLDLESLTGWGADVPILLGYETDAGLYMAWVGVRAGWEHVSLGADGSGSAGTTPSLSATRFWGGGLVGVAVGFRHVHFAAELDANYASVHGRYAGLSADVDGVTLAPAAAAWWTF